MAKKTNPKNGYDGSRVWTSLQAGSYASLDGQMLPETVLKQVADAIKSTDSFGTLFHLIEEIPRRGNDFDWNVGSILQHFEADVVLSALQHVGNVASLYESVGLAWVFGQFRNRHQSIISHLYATVAEAKSSEAWWQAAFSLEKLQADDAVNLLKRSLKASGLKSVAYCLSHLDDKRSLIGLLLADSDATRHDLYANIRETFLGTPSREVLVNCCWLIGRLHLFDERIAAKLVRLTKDAEYTVKKYAFLALQNNAAESVRVVFEDALHGDDLSRRLAARGLRSVSNEKSLPALEAALRSEQEPAIVSELTKTIYRIKNPASRARQIIKQKTGAFENGMMYDMNADPHVYDLFAQAQDPEGICLALVLENRGKKIAVNPVVASMRTGIALRRILAEVKYDGVLYGFDRSSGMCAFAQKKTEQEGKLAKQVRIAVGTISDALKREGIRSNLIVRSFGLPGSVPGAKAVLAELKAVYAALTDDGEYWTLGWDELFNDGLNAMAFKYLPDGIQARDFEEWREKRTYKGITRDMSGLKWFKRGLLVPLQFSSLQESATVMGHLFGRDAAQYVVRNGKTEWSMSVGITRDTKKSIARIIKKLEKTYEE